MLAFSIIRLENVEDFFNLDVFFKPKINVKINYDSFKIFV